MQMNKYLFSFLFFVLLISAIHFLSGCTNPVYISGCNIFGEIYPSRADSLETKKQILAHNLTYKDVCKDEKKSKGGKNDN